MSRIAAVLLAGGGSTRFGQPKQLLDWSGKPLVAHVADLALASQFDPVVVVLGCQAEEVLAALGDRPLRTAMNWQWESGLSTSVRAGLSSLPLETAAAIFMHCDQPLITPTLLRSIAEHFRSTEAPIVYPSHSGRRSSPVLFAQRLFPELAQATGDKGGRSLIDKYADQASALEVSDPLILSDLDTPAEYQALLAHSSSRHSAAEASIPSRIRNLIVDMDGVLWRGNAPQDGLADFFRFLRQNGISFVLATNNASRTPEMYLKKLERFGVELAHDEILTSAQATAAYLSTVASPGAAVYALGMEGLQQALLGQGFNLVEYGAEYVVVGYTIDLSWQMLAAATLQINSGAQLIGTNPDVTFPSEAGLAPGNGAILAALEAATGVTATVIGKPFPWLYQEAMRRMGSTPETTAVIGDRLDTDIAGGLYAGMFTILVLSGITTPRDVETSFIRPDLVRDDIADLAHLWKKDLKL